MIVPQVALNVWRAAADQTRADVFAVRRLLKQGRIADADQRLAVMIEHTIVVGLSMEQAGADKPAAQSPPFPPVPVLPPGTLRSDRGTDAELRFSLLLRAAYDAAKEVDQEARDQGQASDLAAHLEALVDAAELAAMSPAGRE